MFHTKEFPQTNTMNMIQSKTSLRLTAFFALAAAALLTQGAQAQSTTVDPVIVTAKTVAIATADIEAIVGIARTTGAQIGTNQIKLTTTNVKKLTKFMADAIIGKTGNVPSYNPTNQADEIGEVAAFVANAIIANTKFQTNTAKAKDASLALLKGALKTAKTNNTLVSTTTIIKDVVTSVSLTIQNDSRVSDSLALSIKKHLKANAASIAGASKKTKVKNAIIEGFAPTATTNQLYEDGGISTLATISDPETDMRNG